MNIERRIFLQGLLALSFVPLLASFDLELEEDVDKAWDALNRTPFLFQVDTDGILDDHSYDAPKLRREAYDIPIKITSLDDLLYCMEWQPFAWVVDWKYDEFLQHLPQREQTKWLKEIDGGSSDDNKEALEKWSNAIGEKEFIVQMNNALKEWLDEKINITDEEVYADIPLYGGAYVFTFFNNEPDLIEQLDIGLIEGFHPGDDSQHTMLGISMEKANMICIENNLPIRFERA